jgi:hypothetical protein
MRGWVKRVKPGPISFEEMLERIRKSPELTRGDVTWEMWGYSEDVEDDAVRKRTNKFNEWLEREHGLRWESTSNRRLYDAEVVAPYRRKPKNT